MKMKHFIVEGIIRNPERINDEIIKEHMKYTQLSSKFVLSKK